MKIDRTRFLMLTGVIAAAGACTTAAVTTNNGNPDGGPSADAGNGGDAGQNPINEGGDSASPESDGGSDSAVACLGPTGSTSGCAAFADGWSQDAGATSCVTAQVCNGATFVTGGVAASILACAAADTTFDAGCVDLSSCVLTALATACPDPTTASTCGSIVATCGPDSGAGTADGGIPVTEKSCEQYLAGLVDSARDGFSACMVESGCNLTACATGLF